MSFLQKIFSIKNETSKKHKIYKVITIMGIRLKFLNKEKTLLNLINAQQENFNNELKKQSIEIKYLINMICANDKRLILLKDWYFKKTGELLNLDSPQTFNEKIQWLKLYDSTPLKTRLADKYLVRGWIKEKIGEDYLIPLLGVWDKFDDIDFDKLPNQFVLKCNHGCGYNIIVTDKSKLDLNDASLKVNKWLNENFAFKHGFELQYSNIPRKIIAEEYIASIDSDAPIDYKFICCDGNPILCWVTNKKIKPHERSFYSLPQWNLEKIEYCDGGAILAKNPIEKPILLDKMIQICKTLAKDFPVVRVDLYSVGNKIFFGEMTFTSATGIAKFCPDEWNYILGKAITLPSKQ